MFRRRNSLLYFLLVFMLLSGCSENRAVSETGTPPATEISSSQNNENSALDQNVERGVDMTETGSQQPIYLWKKDNIPTTTTYTENSNSQYADPPDFRPNMVYFPAKQGLEVKGAVLIAAGGAFRFRSDAVEGTPVAEAFSELGYQSFVVNYRLRPYSMQEGALDLGRAVRYVRKHAADYGIDEKDIAVIGFSAGGILWGEELLNFDGTVNGTSIDPNYVPDELDKVSADASAVGMIYSFYGRLSVASTDVEKFKNSDLPPAFFAYGTRDPYVGEFEECIEALRQAGVPVEDHVLQGWPHGFGVGDGQWIKDFDRWVTNIFESN
jgi:acetyl esterase/lipase